MRRHVVVFGLVAGLLGTAQASAQGVKTPAQMSGLSGYWQHTGQTFVCQVSSASKLPAPTPDQLIQACQRMGSISIGMSESGLTAALGQPHREHRAGQLQMQRARHASSHVAHALLHDVDHQNGETSCGEPDAIRP